MSQYINPSVDAMQQYFARDFPYTGDATTLTGVNTTDITNAMQKAADFINPALFPDQSSYTTGFLNLSAHYLVLAIRAGSQGIVGQWPWMVTSKGVGGVSTGAQIPNGIMDNPQLAWLTTTYYGTEFVMYIYPMLKGNFLTAHARAHA